MVETEWLVRGSKGESMTPASRTHTGLMFLVILPPFQAASQLHFTALALNPKMTRSVITCTSMPYMHHDTLIHRNSPLYLFTDCWVSLLIIQLGIRLDGWQCQPVSCSTSLVQTEISQKLSDGLPRKFFTDSFDPERVKPTGLDLLAFIPTLGGT